MIASLLAGVYGGSSVHAYPGDVFATASPVQAPVGEAPAAAGDELVSDSGGASYSIPIAVPPGRQGQAPSLALTYSSRSPVRGGLAAGWSFAMPRIEVDTRRGRLAGTHYRSTLAGDRLVPVTETAPADAETFRADRDATFARYERVRGSGGATTMWRVRQLDGSVMYFGETVASRDTVHGATAPGATGARWFLTRVVDRFGNELRYTYDKHYTFIRDQWAYVPVDIFPTMIEWGANAAAGRGHHARVRFTYASPSVGNGDRCPDSWVPIGASLSWRTGFPLMEGARRLDAISVELLEGSTWTERRRYDLRYDEQELSCPAGRTHAPLRLLLSVQERALSPEGAWTVLPATTFDYGRRELELTQQTSLTAYARGENALSQDKAGGWPTIDSMLLDLDGDGRLDRLVSEPDADRVRCGVTWQRNLGDGTFSDPAAFSLPTVSWAGNARDTSSDPTLREGCSLAHQFSRAVTTTELVCGAPAVYQSYRFMDLTGDGKPDLVTAIDANHGRYRPADDESLWPPGSEPTCPGPSAAGACRDSSGTYGPCSVSAPFLTYQDDDEEPTDEGCAPGTCRGWACPHEHCPCYDYNCESDDPYGNQSSVGSEYAAPIDGAAVVDGMFWNGVPWMPEADLNSRIPTHQNYACAHQPEYRCGRFVWRVYPNTGSGFASDPTIVLSPIPLESDRPTSSLGHGSLAASSSWHGFIDIDGDGYTDAVYQTPFWGFDNNEPERPPMEFQVFRGDGTGNFRADANGNPYVWSVPALPLLSGELRFRARVTLNIDRYALPYMPEGAHNVRESNSTVLLTDVNGDGLPDYVDARQPWLGGERVRVYYNTGTGFEVADGYRGTTLDGAAWSGEVYENWSTDNQYVVEQYEGQHLNAGWSRAVQRPVDIDGDGLLDLVVVAPPRRGETNPWAPPRKSVGRTPPPRARLYVNVGDKLVPMGSTPKLEAWAHALARITVDKYGVGSGHWTVVSDFIDLDGDGLPEAFTNDDYNGDGIREAETGCPLDGSWQLPTLCGIADWSWTSPKDGQGPRLLRTVRNGVGSETRFDYKPISGGSVPYPLWVVSTVTTTIGPTADGSAAQAAVTRYDYEQPVYNRDDIGEWGFRGFSRIARTNPSGEHVVTRFDHAIDWAGRRVDMRRYEAVGGRPHSIVKTTWEPKLLFGGTCGAWVETQVETRTCGATQTEQTCEQAGDLRVDTTGWWGYRAGLLPGPVLAYAVFQTQAGNPLAVLGATRDNRSHLLYSDATTYRLNLLEESREVAGTSGTFAMISRTVHSYDPSGRVETATNVYSDASTFARTNREFDMPTGNVKRVQKPEQIAANVWTTFEYEPTQVHVTRTTNELGHAIEATWDRATGVQISQRGPNKKAGLAEGWTRRIDGLGRPLTRTVYVDDTVAGYVPMIVERWTYADTPDASGFRRITAEQRIELNEDRWTKTETDLDGEGRDVIVTTRDGATVASIRRNHRDASGRVVRIDAPAPNGSGVATVPYTYSYDAHGRLTTTIGPDGRGQTFSYDGRVRTRTDALGPDGGAAGATRTRHDLHDRLVEVGELRDDDSWAITQYAHDGNGNLVRTVDADGVETLMAHDWRSHRTHIVRSGKTWRYGYDRNGRLISMIAPGPAGAEAAYTTTIVYDHLDREISRVGGSRTLDDAQLARYGAASVQRAYDLDTLDNGIGRLSTVTQPWGITKLRFDARGLVRERSWQLTGIGQSGTDGRVERMTYNALGGLRDVTYADTQGAAPPTRVKLDTSARGLPSTTILATGPAQTLAQHLYSARGVKTRRTTGTAVHEIAHNVAGRVTNHDVKVGTAPRLDIDVEYDGAGEVDAMAWGFGGANDTFTFAYDRQHQLRSASGPLGYAATFTYTGAGRLLDATVAVDPGVPGVSPRDVRYDYDSDGDLESPDALTSPDGQPWMSIARDPSGNATKRTTAEGSWYHFNDGFDLQREVIAPDGRREVYYYDADRQRVAVVAFAASGARESIRWTFGATEVLYDANGAVSKTIAHVGHDGPIARIENRTNVEHVFAQHHGHVALVLDASMTMIGGFVYGPFGELLRQVGSQVPELLRRNNGKEHDARSRLDYYGYRYYDPQALIWTQADPLYRLAPDLAYDEPRRMSSYTYSLNNPLRYTDPDGLQNNDEEDDPKPVVAEPKPNPGVPPVTKPTEETPSVVYVITAKGMRNSKVGRENRRRVLEPVLDALVAKGYTIFWIDDASLSDARAAFDGSQSAGMIVDGHGNTYTHRILFGELGAPTAEKEYLGPWQITSASEGLEFVLLVTCTSGQHAQAWADRIGATVYAWENTTTWYDTGESGFAAKAAESLPDISSTTRKTGSVSVPRGAKQYRGSEYIYEALTIFGY